MRLGLGFAVLPPLTSQSVPTPHERLVQDREIVIVLLHRGLILIWQLIVRSGIPETLSRGVNSPQEVDITVIESQCGVESSRWQAW